MGNDRSFGASFLPLYTSLLTNLIKACPLCFSRHVSAMNLSTLFVKQCSSGLYEVVTLSGSKNEFQSPLCRRSQGNPRLAVLRPGELSVCS